MEIRTDYLAAAVRHAEAAEGFTGETRRALERIAADYWRRAVGAVPSIVAEIEICDAPSRHIG